MISYSVLLFDIKFHNHHLWLTLKALEESEKSIKNALESSMRLGASKRMRNEMHMKIKGERKDM